MTRLEAVPAPRPRPATWPSAAGHGRWVWVLCGLIALRVVLAVVLWNRAGGYFWLTGDDASRTQLAYIWSRTPFFNIAGNVWPPLGFWLHGLVLLVVDDPLAVSSAVNSIFSIATIVVVYKLTAVLFPERPSTSAIAAAMAGFSPLVVWLGLSGLSEPIFHFFMLAGVYAWVRADYDLRPRLYLGAALGLLGASMVRLEGWILAGLFCACCVLGARRRERALLLLSSALVASLFVPAWLWWHWHTFGDPLAFLQVLEGNNAGGLSAPDFSRYVSLLWDNSPLALMLAPLGAVLALGSDAPESGRTRRYCVAGIVVFFLCFVLLTRGRLASNMPVRNLTGIYLLLVPFAAYALAFMAGRASRSTTITYVMVAGMVAAGATQSFGYRFQASDGVVGIASWSRGVIRSGALTRDSDKILIEARRGGAAERLIVFDSLFLHAVNPGYTVYDRRPRLIAEGDTWVITELNNPSLLDGPAVEVKRRLQSRHVRFVIAYSPTVRATLESFMTSVKGPASLGAPSMPAAAGDRPSLEYSVYGWPDDEPSATAPGSP